MSDDRLEAELARRLAEIPVPEDSEQRTIAAVRAIVAEEGTRRRSEVTRRRWWRRRRPRTLLALAAALLVAGGAAVAALEPWSPDRAPQVPASRESAERIVADPLLSQLAWITWQRGPDGGPARIQFLPEQPSLVFPAGVGYEEAFARLLDSLASEGTLPPEAHLGPPLPAGKVVRLPSDRSDGVALDLRAPRGYLIPSGRLPAGFAAAPGWSEDEIPSKVAEAREQGLIVPLDAVIEPMELEPCQVLDPGSPSPPCRLSPPLGSAPTP